LVVSGNELKLIVPEIILAGYLTTGKIYGWQGGMNHFIIRDGVGYLNGIDDEFDILDQDAIGLGEALERMCSDLSEGDEIEAGNGQLLGIIKLCLTGGFHVSHKI